MAAGAHSPEVGVVAALVAFPGGSRRKPAEVANQESTVMVESTVIAGKKKGRDG
jgi:hypothetical protein